MEGTPAGAAAYPYVFVDARYEGNARVDGLREILAVEVADTESEATHQELFRSLKGRGLSEVELVVPNDHESLKAVLARHFQRHRGGAARSTTRGTSSAWWAPGGAKTLRGGRAFE